MPPGSPTRPCSRAVPTETWMPVCKMRPAAVAWDKLGQYERGKLGPRPSLCRRSGRDTLTSRVVVQTRG